MVLVMAEGFTYVNLDLYIVPLVSTSTWACRGRFHLILRRTESSVTLLCPRGMVLNFCSLIYLLACGSCIFSTI